MLVIGMFLGILVLVGWPLLQKIIIGEELTIWVTVILGKRI